MTLLDTDTKYEAAQFIETYTGRAFYPLAPNIEAVSIIDIAHALANQCRYSGHTAFFYPTAQHCCLLAGYVVKTGGRAIDALQILMHDAAEAYLIDMPRPVKQHMPVFRQWDHSINKVIRSWMDWDNLPIPTWQDELDSRIIADERAQLMSRSGNDWGHQMAPLGVRIEPWTPEEAEKAFLIQYAAYSHEAYGAHQYLNTDWGIPAKLYHSTASDHDEIADVMEVDVRGGVARVRLRDSEGIMVRDPSVGQFPMPDYEWVHGKYSLIESKAT
jgi:hypothetical protein